MKTHISLTTPKLEESVRFYTTLLQHPPMKSLEDYALFVLDDPGLRSG